MSKPRQAYVPESVVAAMKGATGAEWGVLVVLYLHANPEGEARPSIGTITRLTGYERRTVTRALERLEGRIGLRRIKPHPGRETTTYRLPTRGAHVPSKGRLGAQESPTRGVQVPQLGTHTPPKQGLNSNEQGGAPVGDPAGPPDAPKLSDPMDSITAAHGREQVALLLAEAQKLAASKRMR